MNYKKFLSFLTIAVFSTAIVFTGCSTASTTSSNGGTVTTSVSTSDSSDNASASEYFTDRDYDYSYDTSEATSVTLNDSETYTISEEGVYILSGDVANAQIVVDAEDSAKVQIVLDGLTMTNESTACIYCLSADKVFITTADGSTNRLSVTESFVAIDDNNIDGVIYAKTDITLNGGGTLAIECADGHGVVSKDDVKVTSGTYNITASEHGIQGKDSIRIGGGELNISSGEDGLHSSNTDDLEKGYVYICGGTLNIFAEDDGIHANTDLIIDGGTVNITKSYEGLEAQNITINDGDVNVTASDDGLNATSADDVSGEESSTDFGMGMDEADGVSTITINGGTLTVNADGDGVDSNGDLTVNGGTIYVEGPTNDGNGPLDYAGNGTINGGTFIAIGSSGMAMNFGSDSTQGSILVTLDSSTSGEVQICDSEGNTLVSYTPSKSYRSVVVSTADITDGSTYTLMTGSTTTEITMDGLIYGESNGMFGGGGRGQVGQMPNDGNFPGNGEAPSGDFQPDENFQPGNMPQRGNNNQNNSNNNAINNN